ncbi:MAG: methyltransferase domain-containing protein [Arcobacteraceae bacterium]|nr:methyltransferase domain-containing protein [Arcobacteraceae bacterium]
MSTNSIQNQFSKYAQEYGNNNIIQQIVSKALVRDIVGKPKKILELGCGSGQVFKYIDWEFDFYKAIDGSKDMCKIHPKATNLEVCCQDFDSDDFYDEIKNDRYDIVLSSSALQWSKDIDKLIQRLISVTKEINVVLFTSNTFKSIQDITKQNSPILNLETIKKSFSEYLVCDFEVFNYNLEFSNKKEMFNYIKNSGVSGKSILSYKEAKQLYKEYDLNYLEFEVIFIKAFSKS